MGWPEVTTEFNPLYKRMYNYLKVTKGKVNDSFVKA